VRTLPPDVDEEGMGSENPDDSIDEAGARETFEFLAQTDLPYAPYAKRALRALDDREGSRSPTDE
jgi:hypothetical protein